jgi:threonine dehydratase
VSRFPITLDDVRQAAERLRDVVRPTPLLRSDSFSALAGCTVYLKAENLQVTGSFKIRGAANKIACLSPEERARGVVAASMGNHAQGVAYAATHFGVHATVVMPAGAPLSKYRATQSYGAEVILHGNSFEESLAAAQRIVRETGAVFIHAYDDWDIIAGQGTLALDILQELPDADALVVPLGGGGLIAGMAIAARAVRPRMRLIGVQAAGCASFPAALAAGAPIALEQARTIADGIRVKQPGHKTFAVIRALVDDVLTVDDEAISLALVQLLERRKLVVEGAGAASLAALIYGGAHGLPRESRAVAVLGGGNIDVTLLGRIINYALAIFGRFLMVQITMPDTPGQLTRALQICGELRANISQVEHFRGEMHIPVGLTSVLLSMETRDAAHQAAIVAALRERGYPVRQVSPGSSTDEQL